MRWVSHGGLSLLGKDSSSSPVQRNSMSMNPYLKRQRQQRMDIAIGKYTGAAPWPSLSTLRVQMVNLLENLR